VADALPKAAKDIAAAYGAEVRTIDEIAKAKDIDAVVICTPTDTHADLIEKFARAGKAIFCEKPIDLSVVRVRQCLEVVAQTGATLMVGFNRRFDPHFMAVQAGDRGRLHRQGRAGSDHLARSRPAALRLHQRARAASSAT
jgi:myo-inositol 2-dehydrogenase/D-chiro-inositol 1-dehydrogenase